MSDKELALDSIRRLPEDARLDAIAERLEVLAAIRKGGRKFNAVKLCRMKKSNANWPHGFDSNLAFSLQTLAFLYPPPPAGKPPFRPNYFHFCKCVNSVPTPPNPRIHNALAGVETPIFD